MKDHTRSHRHQHERRTAKQQDEQAARIIAADPSDPIAQGEYDAHQIPAALRKPKEADE